MGPNQAATAPVPRLWTANRPTRISRLSGSTTCPKAGVTSSSPSTADSTEIAGVMTASPIEQRRAEHAQKRDQPDMAAERPLDQRHQAQRAALAVIVHAHDERDVFQRDDDDQRPQHQRFDAKHHFAGQRAVALRREQALLDRIKRAGADIAIDDADAAERQRPEAPPAAGRAVGRLRSRFRRLRVQSHVNHCKPLSWCGGHVAGPGRRRTVQSMENGRKWRFTYDFPICST